MSGPRNPVGLIRVKHSRLSSLLYGGSNGQSPQLKADGTFEYGAGGGGGGDFNHVVTPPDEPTDPGNQNDISYRDEYVYIHDGTKWLAIPTVGGGWNHSAL